MLKVHLESSVELKAAMVSLGFDSKNALIYKMITKLDEDGSGKLEFNEWLHLMTYKVTPASSREAIDKIFPLYDNEGTGFISVKCLQQVCDNLGITVPEEELQEMITRADLDQDGLVNGDEFYAILTRPIKE
jgi:centrin-1